MQKRYRRPVGRRHSSIGIRCRLVDVGLLHVKAIRFAANHQFAARVHDLRLKIVDPAPDFLDLKRRAGNHVGIAVEIHAYLMSALKAWLQIDRGVENSAYVPQCFFSCR